MQCYRVTVHHNECRYSMVCNHTFVLTGIDTDCLEGRIFWTDVSGRKIKSAAYNGSQRVDFAMGGMASILYGFVSNWNSRFIQVSFTCPVGIVACDYRYIHDN